MAVLYLPIPENKRSLECRTLLASPLCGCLLVTLRIDLNVVVADNKDHGGRSQE